MTLLLTLIWLGTPALAAVRGAVHGLSSAQLRKLRAMPSRAVLPGKLPPGYKLKDFQAQLGSSPSYLLEYRCFCSGMNYTIALLGTTKPYQPGKPLKSEQVSVKGLGTRLQLGYYPANQRFRTPYYLSSGIGKPPFVIGVLSARQGHSAPHADLLGFVQGLEYIK